MAPPSVETEPSRSRQTSREIWERELSPVSPLTCLGLTENQFKIAIGLSEEAPSPSTVRRALEASAGSSPGLGRRGPSAATAVSQVLDDEAAKPTARGDPLSGVSRRRMDAALTLEAKLDKLDQKFEREVRPELQPPMNSWERVRQHRRRSTGSLSTDISSVVSRMDSRRASAPNIVPSRMDSRRASAPSLVVRQSS